MCHAMNRELPQTASEIRPRAGERGSALLIALLVVVILALLGLSFMLAGETESKIARNQRDAAQAGFVAEGGVRMVKRWFDAPVPGSPNAHFMPLISEMDRTQRGVDDDGDGTYKNYTQADDPAYRVIYRQGTNDPFEKPYRGTPANTLLGDEFHPDVRISDSPDASGGSAAQRDFLSRLNAELYPLFPDPARNQLARIRQIDVYGPPILIIGGQRTRYGIATVKVTATIYQYVGTPQETRIATRIVKAVLNEAPYLTGPGGPLQSCTNITETGSFSVHWGPATAVTSMDLANNIDSKIDSSIPYKPNSYNFIEPDMNGDGTHPCTTGVAGSAPDDMDCDGTLDFNNWLSDPTGVDDPWIRFVSQSTVTSGGITGTCSTNDCQPMPFYMASRTPHLGTGDKDHSNLFQLATRDLCPVYDYAFWKNVALSGGDNVYYYQYAGPGPKYRLPGQVTTAQTFQEIVTGKSGVFFFDTTDSTAPSGTNLPTISMSGTSDSITSGGFIYLNANLSTNGSGSVLYPRQLIAPGEPFIDTNGNNKYDPDESFIDVTYPGALGAAYVKNGIHKVADGSVRQDPAIDAGSAGKWMANINFAGVLYISGAYDAQGNWTFFGTVVTKAGMPGNNAGTPDFYWDERLIKDQWPPVDLNIPRTVISAWQTDL